MGLSKACAADPGHKLFKRFHVGLRPVVLSSDRFNGIVSRSRQQEKLDMQEALEEEQRYRQYLQDGNKAVMKGFTNMVDWSGQDEEALEASRYRALINRAKDQKAQQLLEEMRKERIMRANRIMHLLKPGPHLLHEALLTSDLIYQRNYDQQLKREFAAEAQEDEEKCPERLIPFGKVTEAQEKAQQQMRTNEMREYYLKDLEERRQRKLEQQQQELHDCIVEREQYKCLQEQEDKAARERAARKREFCQRAYRESLEEKEAAAKYERMCDKIEDRINCIDRTAQRNMSARYGKQIRQMREQRTRALEASGVQLCRERQAKERQLLAQRAEAEERDDAKERLVELRRGCEIDRLSKERRAYELEAQHQQVRKRQRDAEIRRYQLATRLKNANCQKLFVAGVKKRKDAETAKLREFLHGQRKEFLEQRQAELMRITACDEDPYLRNDVDFFEDAVQTMTDCQEVGRPLYPIAKAAEIYRRDNKLDTVPEAQMVSRNKLRDYCWPGYISKAQLAYRKYEQREKCRREQKEQRHKVFSNCIKITKMAAEERPYKRCPKECPERQIQHREMKSVTSMKMPGLECWDEKLPPPNSPSNKQFDAPDEFCDNLAPCITPDLKPGDEYPSGLNSILKADESSKHVFGTTTASKDSQKSVRIKADKEQVRSMDSEVLSTVIEKKYFLKAPDSLKTLGDKKPSTITFARDSLKGKVPSTVRIREKAGKKPSTATLCASDNNLSKAGCARNSTLKHKTGYSDLTRYWTAKPQLQAKTEVAPPNYPIISLIDAKRTAQWGPKSARSENRKHFL